MPGLLGYWTQTKESLSSQLLADMAGSMQHQPDLKTETFIVPGFGAGRVHLGYFQPKPQPAKDDVQRYFLWLDGEFNNASDLAKLYDINPLYIQEQAALALALYQKVGWAFLRDMDGLFNIALYDKYTHQLTLVNDRFGLRPLYWVRTSRGVAYAGEVKALLKISDVLLEIDKVAIDEWFSFGYLLGNRTWIEKIELCSPATIIQVSAEDVTIENYWSWGDIQPFLGKIDEAEIVEELGRLWIQAVSQRIDDHKIGVSLSGGLDSRAVLAAMPKNMQQLCAITFGVAGCDDHRIAASVAEVHGINHLFMEINKFNFLEPRISALWRTDGLARILDLHGVEAIPYYRRHIEVDLQSFAGDLILGGSYLNNDFLRDWTGSFPVVFAKMWLKSPLVSYDRGNKLLWEVWKDYANLLHSDFFFLDNRVRRFTNCGTIALNSVVERSFPTYGLELVKFIYSLPDCLRVDSYIYSKMLLNQFLPYYRDIPWQKTGLPLSASGWQVSIEKAKRGVAHILRLLGVSIPNSRGYTNYPAWLRDEPARNFMTRLLLDQDALYPTYVDPTIAHSMVASFLNTNSNRFLVSLGLLITFEIYLRQIFASEQLNALVHSTLPNGRPH